MLRRLLLALPAVAVGIVLWAVLSAGWPQPVDVAQVVGGPTRGSSTLSWQLCVQQVDDGQRSPIAGRPLLVTLTAGALHATWRGVSDGAGLAEARIPLAQPLGSAAWVRVEAADTGSVLAEGNVELEPERWRDGARRQGGWYPGQQRGELWLRVAPAEATLAVPFASELVIEATRGLALAAAAGGGLRFGEQPAAGVELELELSGAERTAAAESVRTDATGRAHVGVKPLEHAVRLHLTARTQGDTPGERPLAGEWYGALHVTPGALHVALDGTALQVRAPIPRATAYVSLVDESQRLAGYAVELQADADGGASARIELEREVLARAQTEPVYAVVSSEPDKRSPSAVGWPLRATAGSAPALSFDVPDQLLLDGTAGGLAAERAARVTRRWVAALLLALVGGLMLVAFTREVRSKARPLPREPLAEAELPPLALTSQSWWLGLALLCLLFGMAALAYFGLLQR